MKKFLPWLFLAAVVLAVVYFIFMKPRADAVKSVTVANPATKTDRTVDSVNAWLTVPGALVSSVQSLRNLFGNGEAIANDEYLPQSDFSGNYY